MAIKGGQILHVGNGVTVIDRIQTAGPGQLNIPTEKIYELGNYKSVATIRDTPDLTFTMESFDVSTEIEQLVTDTELDGRTATASMADKSSTITSADAAFTQADVGRQVVVPGGMDVGVDLIATIVSVTNGTTAVLSGSAQEAVTDATVSIGAVIDLQRAVPIDIASQFKAGVNAPLPFRVTTSVALPYLTLEQMSYRFGLRDNATQTATLRGDTIFYNPGAAFVEEVAATGGTQEIITAHPAYAVAEGEERRILAVTIANKRASLGVDYSEVAGAETNGAATVTVQVGAMAGAMVPEAGDTIRIIYSSPDAADYPQSVHADTVVKPAAVKGRDIEVYLGGYDPTTGGTRLQSVQSVNVDWRVTLEKDEEFGNYYAVAQDFETPTVNGSVDIKPRDNEDFMTLLRRVTGADPNTVIGTSTAVPMPLDIVLKHPETGDTLKRLHVPDARFTVPGYSGRVNQKLTVSLSFESDEGTLLIFER